MGCAPSFETGKNLHSCQKQEGGGYGKQKPRQGSSPPIMRTCPSLVSLIDSLRSSQPLALERNESNAWTLGNLFFYESEPRRVLHFQPNTFASGYSVASQGPGAPMLAFAAIGLTENDELKHLYLWTSQSPNLVKVDPQWMARFLLTSGTVVNSGPVTLVQNPSGTWLSFQPPNGGSSIRAPITLVPNLELSANVQWTYLTGNLKTNEDTSLLAVYDVILNQTIVLVIQSSTGHVRLSLFLNVMYVFISTALTIGLTNNTVYSQSVLANTTLDSHTYTVRDISTGSMSTLITTMSGTFYFS